MTETAYYTRKNLIIAFVVGFIIGFGSYYVLHNAPFNKTPHEENEKEASGETLIEQEKEVLTIATNSDNLVSVADQLPGFSVKLDSATLEKESWIAVRETNEDGSLANILGAWRYPAGTFENIQISLSRNTVEDEQYYVVIYQDDGNKDEFDFREKDVLLKDPVTDEIVKFGFTTLSTR